MDAAHRTASRDRSIVHWKHSGAERFWSDPADRPIGDLTANSSDRQMINPVRDIGVLLLLLLTGPGDGFGAREARALVETCRRLSLPLRDAITPSSGIVPRYGNLVAADTRISCVRLSFYTDRAHHRRATRRPPGAAPASTYFPGC
jgi:hypothetical protein